MKYKNKTPNNKYADQIDKNSKHSIKDLTRQQPKKTNPTDHIIMIKMNL